MVEKVVLKLVDRMERENIIEKADREYYEYALMIMAEHIIAVGSMLVIGICFKQLVPTIVFLIFFLSLRKRTGGYHADKFWQCYLVSIIIYIEIIQVALTLSQNPFIIYVILVPAVLVVEMIGTVNHPNIDMSKAELRETKKAARIVALIEAVVIVASIVLGINQLYVCYMSIAIILCASLMCLAKMLKQEVKL